jgi:hypothetical protein
MAGIIPGLMGFDWKYIIFVAVSSPLTIGQVTLNWTEKLRSSKLK